MEAAIKPLEDAPSTEPPLTQPPIPAFENTPNPQEVTETPKQSPLPPPAKQIIPGLTITKTEEKELKDRKKEAAKKNKSTKKSTEDDYIWEGGLTEHPLIQADNKLKKRNAAAAALSPPDKTPLSRSKLKI